MTVPHEAEQRQSVLRVLFTSACLSLAVAPYFTLLAIRYSTFDRYDSQVWGAGLDMAWFAFPFFYVAALALAKGRMRLFVLLYALIIVPYLHDWRKATRGYPVPSPWYSTERFDVVPDGS